MIMEFVQYQHRSVLEVEIVSHADNKSWFVFEVELSGQTLITLINVMSKVSEAANRVVKLPEIPARRYND